MKLFSRICMIIFFSTLYWRISNFIYLQYSGNEYNQMYHIAIGLFLSFISYILVSATLKLDNRKWQQIGSSSLSKNSYYFTLGIILWLIPAFISLGICLKLNWISINLKINGLELFRDYLILFVTVFFVEAFPEEIIMRGYIYSSFESMISKTRANISQTLVFLLFAFLINSLISIDQWLFIAGYGLILGYLRSKTGSVWTSIGFHTILMTTTQIFNTFHGGLEVSNIFLLQFLVFNFIPYVFVINIFEYTYKPEKDYM